MVRLAELKEIVAAQVDDAADLVGLLELTLDDILDRFPDALMDNKEKFGVVDSDEA
jgi:hypothetical protein